MADERAVAAFTVGLMVDVMAKVMVEMTVVKTVLLTVDVMAGNSVGL